MGVARQLQRTGVLPGAWDHLRGVVVGDVMLTVDGRGGQVVRVGFCRLR